MYALLFMHDTTCMQVNQALAISPFTACAFMTEVLCLVVWYWVGRLINVNDKCNSTVTTKNDC